MIYTIGDMFAGIGGFSLAGHAAGFRTSWFVEREPYPVKVLNKNFPGVPVYGDVFECHNLPYVDVITAGFPCQPFSLAGKRQGVNDERYLVPEMLRVIREVQPMVCIFENVPGFASIADGDTFRQFLGALAEIGFDAEWQHLRASDAGAPHQRERWFCVAYASELRRNTGRAEQPLQGVRSRSSTWPNGELADADSRRQQQYNAGQRFISFNDAKRSNMGHASGERRQEFHPSASDGYTRRITGSAYPITGTGFAQSNLGRVDDGLPAGLHQHPGWPARPGSEQYAYEPPRVTTSATPNRAARLKALGNSIVPQVVYPIFLAVKEYLDALESERAA